MFLFSRGSPWQAATTDPPSLPAVQYRDSCLHFLLHGVTRVAPKTADVRHPWSHFHSMIVGLVLLGFRPGVGRLLHPAWCASDEVGPGFALGTVAA